MVLVRLHGQFTISVEQDKLALVTLNTPSSVNLLLPLVNKYGSIFKRWAYEEQTLKFCLLVTYKSWKYTSGMVELTV